jgi:hypothetical protein
MTVKLTPEFLTLVKAVTKKRAKVVIDHLIAHGQLTTDELKDLYGYSHAPRAIRDVRELGIPIETINVKGKDGKTVAAYKFGDPSNIRATQLSGRTAFSKKLKDELVEKFGPTCAIYLEPFPIRELQIDHRIPFEIAGETEALSEGSDNYMLVCASANRAKSWSCEHCPNWQKKDKEVCRKCYWASPESYQHIATRDIRRLDLLWAGEAVVEYEAIVTAAFNAQESAPEYVKAVMRIHLDKIRKA